MKRLNNKKNPCRANIHATSHLSTKSCCSQKDGKSERRMVTQWPCWAGPCPAITDWGSTAGLETAAMVSQEFRLPDKSIVRRSSLWLWVQTSRSMARHRHGCSRNCSSSGDKALEPQIKSSSLGRGQPWLQPSLPRAVWRALPQVTIFNGLALSSGSQAQKTREDVVRASIPGSDGEYAPERKELQQCNTWDMLEFTPGKTFC